LADGVYLRDALAAVLDEVEGVDFVDAYEDGVGEFIEGVDGVVEPKFEHIL
jgi:hypothetical protein